MKKLLIYLLTCLGQRKIVGAWLQRHALSISMFTGAIVSVLVSSFASFAVECEQIPRDVLRLHILAHSDSEYDQRFKYELRDHILKEYSTVLSKSDSLDSAKKTSLNLLSEMQADSQKFAIEQNYDKDISRVELTEMYFTTRAYDGFVLPAGKYNALRITIGDGNGENWWCVMFPPLCIPAVTESNSDISADAVDVIKVSEARSENPKLKFAIFEFLSKKFS